MLCGQYITYVVNTCGSLDNRREGRLSIVVEVRVDSLLESRGRSFYWLSKETGISHTTLWRLKKGKALGINFETLEKICNGLNCQPGDVLRMASMEKTRKRRAAKSKGAKR
jgi:putative transcriptional regulator